MTSFTAEAGGAFSMWRARCTKHLQLSIKRPILRAGLRRQHGTSHTPSSHIDCHTSTREFSASSPPTEHRLMSRVAQRKSIKSFRESSDVKATALCALDIGLFALLLAGVILIPNIFVKAIVIRSRSAFRSRACSCSVTMRVIKACSETDRSIAGSAGWCSCRR